MLTCVGSCLLGLTTLVAPWASKALASMKIVLSPRKNAIPGPGFFALKKHNWVTHDIVLGGYCLFPEITM